MARINIVLPAMGEGVIEATITKWLVSEGTSVNEDDPIVEVATDKVDSEVPSPLKGTVVEITAAEGSVPRVGDTIAILEDNMEYKSAEPDKVDLEVRKVRETADAIKKEEILIQEVSKEMKSRTPSGKFLSPLVRSIAAAEGLDYSEIDKINGSGMDGRITRDDILTFLAEKKKPAQKAEAGPGEKEAEIQAAKAPSGASATGDEIIEMDRVRKLIAEHMVMSKRTSAHVTSFIDADVTKLALWRNSVKEKFLEREGQKLTFTPIFIDAVARAISDFPLLNSSVDGTRIIKKHNINIGMATALPNGNLIVPVIRNANENFIQCFVFAMMLIFLILVCAHLPNLMI